VSLLADSAVKDTRKRPAAGMPQLLLEADQAIAGDIHGRTATANPRRQDGLPTQIGPALLKPVPRPGLLQYAEEIGG
jgi:hypothetical protein